MNKRKTGREEANHSELVDAHSGLVEQTVTEIWEQFRSSKP